MSAKPSAAADKYGNLPPVVIATRTRTTASIHNIPNSEQYKNTTIVDNNNVLPFTMPAVQHTQQCTHIQATPLLWCIVTTDSIQLYTRTYKLICTILRNNVSSISFSATCKYLCTWQVKSSDTQPENLLIYDLTQLHSNDTLIDTHDVITITEPRYRYLYKLEIKWHEHPPIQFGSNDTLMFYRHNNNIYIHELSDTSNRYKQQLHLEHLATYSICDTTINNTITTHIATFQAQHAAQPAKLSIYNTNDITTVHANKQMFKAEEALIRWSSNGQYCLVQTATFTDKSGKSYYGQSQLHIVSIDNALNTTVTFNQPGPIQDFRWHPQIQHAVEFIVIQGFQPAKAILYTIQNNTIVPLRDYGNAARNTIVWSSHGRYVMLGGFGNLAGEMDYWDNLKFKKLGTCQDNDGAKLYEWTPDSRYLITAALRPWRNVDNGYKIYTYAGELVLHQQYNELWQVVIQPAVSQAVYPSRPPSPRLSAARQSAKLQPVQQTTKTSYVPPHLRGKTNGSATTATNNVFKHDISGPKKLTGTNNTAQPVTNAVKQPVKQLSVEEQLHQQQKQLHKQLKQIAEVKARVERGQEIDSKQQTLLSNESKINSDLNEITEKLKNMF